MKGRVLIIAGSDSGGGAGIQADIKTVTMLDGFAATAITALTAQNTLGVFGILPVPPEFIRTQIEIVLVPQEIARFQDPVAGHDNGHFTKGFDHVLHPRSVAFP